MAMETPMSSPPRWPNFQGTATKDVVKPSTVTKKACGKTIRATHETCLGVLRNGWFFGGQSGSFGWMLGEALFFGTPAYEWRIKLLTTRNGHGPSGWSPIGCEGFCTKFDIPSPLPTTLVFRSFCRQFIWLVIW